MSRYGKGQGVPKASPERCGKGAEVSLAALRSPREASDGFYDVLDRLLSRNFCEGLSDLSVR